LPENILVGKRIVLEFEDGSYSFNRFDLLATNDEMYDLAMKLNAFQNEQPKSVNYVSKTQII
jgi:hypothetical protein